MYEACLLRRAHGTIHRLREQPAEQYGRLAREQRQLRPRRRGRTHTCQTGRQNTATCWNVYLPDRPELIDDIAERSDVMPSIALEDDPRVMELRDQLPALSRHTYLNTGTAGPLSRAVIDAVAAQMAR